MFRKSLFLNDKESIFNLYFCNKTISLLKTKLFLITPPFTQLNTPYPATAYIKGFLNTKNIVLENNINFNIQIAY